MQMMCIGVEEILSALHFSLNNRFVSASCIPKNWKNAQHESLAILRYIEITLYSPLEVDR